jgi:membrane fusion protein (multidrug efflux system)
VSVNLHDTSGPLLAKQAPTQPAFTTDVYKQQLAKADGMIADIIHANMAGEGQKQ